jgi:Cu-Zn family superoxide dismutase
MNVRISTPRSRAKAPIGTLVLLGAACTCAADTVIPLSSDRVTAVAAPVSRAAAPSLLAVPAAPPSPPIPQAAAPAADAPIHQPSSLAPLPTATLAARAELAPTSGNEARGSVEFYLAEPAMVVYVELTGVKPGMHGFHVHEKGSCDGPNAGGAGGHLNPLDARHGDPRDADQRHHAGDLGNVRGEDNGTVKQWLRTKDLQLQGPAGIVGRAIVVHAREDDLKSQPGGESGEPIACGVIRAIDS